MAAGLIATVDFEATIRLLEGLGFPWNNGRAITHLGYVLVLKHQLDHSVSLR